MAVGDWLRPPRYLVTLFLGIALLLIAALAWLGWQLFRQDRALEQQRVQVRLERSADAVAAELARRMGSLENGLAALASLAPPDVPDSALRIVDGLSHDAVVLVLDDSSLAAYPRDRLPYYPVVPAAPEPDRRVFAEGEALEFRRGDFDGAAEAYRRLARSRDTAVRAGALLRVARAERKAGNGAAALSAYDALANVAGPALGGSPADLVARHATLAVLEELARADALRARARALYADLQAGRWRLTRAQYAFYTAAVCDHIACGSAGDTAAEGDALGEGASWLWDRRASIAAAGRELISVDGRRVLVVWSRSPQRVVALVGGATHLFVDWLGGLGPVLGDQGVAAAFADLNGSALTPPVGSPRQVLITRSVADTRLPWNLQIASADPAADFAELAGRRRLMQLGLVALALFAAVGVVAVMRGVGRELEIARLQSEFVAAVSHEFRTPLTSLRQLAELLSSGRVASDERRRRYYQVMERESARLHRLVEGLLDFGRMEAGAMEFAWERIVPADLVRRVVTDFTAEQGEDGVRVELELGRTTATVRADPEALRRAVWNLLDNAVKYSQEARDVWVLLSQENGQMAIAVRDAGVGIPPAERTAVFEKFVRGSSSDGRGIKGTGIGLAMVKHIVEAHGGQVRLDSEVGHGSTFTILLPVEE